MQDLYSLMKEIQDLNMDWKTKYSQDVNSAQMIYRFNAIPIKTLEVFL